MKAQIFTNRYRHILSPQALLLGFLLLVSPVAIWANSGTEGGDTYMNTPAELSMEGFEAELSLEEWMTQPFELSPAHFEAELSLEEWMVQPFDHGFSDFEEELVVEDWMIQPF
jgi:hypothetical protein